MAQLKNYREVGVFDLLSAPLNPIGAFDAEQFKKDVRELIDSNPDDKFVAVDLMGLDFVYSDAYNAFIQFQQELSLKGGMLALLTNSKSIADGLKKAGLDKKLKTFSFEAELMSFSLHSQEDSEDSRTEEPSRAPITSQNGLSKASGSEPAKRSERKTSQNRRFTKSFNAIVRKEKDLEKKGMDNLFSEEMGSKKTALVIVVVLVAVIASIAFFTLL